MTAADRWTWIDIVRRARLGRTTKGVAYLIATYADNDGSRIFPGVATVAVAAEVDYKTAKKALAELVSKGLLERVGAHARVRGGATEYRLVLADDLQEHVEVLSPAEFELDVERKRRTNRRDRTGNARPRTEPDVQGTAAPVPDEDDDTRTGNGVPADEGCTGNGVPSYGERESAVHNHDMNTTTTYPIAANLSTAVTVPSDSTPDQDPIFGEEKPRLRLVQPPKRGLGFCIDCYAVGQFTVAADPEHGSACAHHLQQQAS